MTESWIVIPISSFKSLTKFGNPHYTPEVSTKTTITNIALRLYNKPVYSSHFFLGGRFLIRLGDKELDYNPDFKFYITTKLGNPHYTPEISTKTTITNFAVKEDGLEAQLLGIVVRKERPELEEQKDSLVMNIAAGKKKLAELEDEILR